MHFVPDGVCPLRDRGFRGIDFQKSEDYHRDSADRERKRSQLVEDIDLLALLKAAQSPREVCPEKLPQGIRANCKAVPAPKTQETPIGSASAGPFDLEKSCKKFINCVA